MSNTKRPLGTCDHRNSFGHPADQDIRRCPDCDATSEDGGTTWEGGRPLAPAQQESQEHVCKPSCHNPCLLDEDRRGVSPAGQAGAQPIEAIRNALSKLESQIVRNPDLPEAYRTICNQAFDAIQHLEFMANNFCAKHREVVLCSTGPCVMCDSAAPSGEADKCPTLDKLVNRFLCWPLPDSVCSDVCATKAGTPHRSGTNLLTAIEAKAMLEHVLKGWPSAGDSRTTRPLKYRDWLVRILEENPAYMVTTDEDERAEAYHLAAQPASEGERQTDYWKSRAETAEAKVLTFHAEIAGLNTTLSDRERLVGELVKLLLDFGDDDNLWLFNETPETLKAADDWKLRRLALIEKAGAK